MSSELISTQPPASYKYHFFISYTTREDEVKIIKPFIDDYIRELQSGRYGNEIPVYYDGLYLRDSSYSEDELATALTQGIKESAFTVSFLSPGYITSEWCAFEWLMTESIHQQRGHPAQAKSILPIMWKGIPSDQESVSPELDEYLRKRKWIDVSGKINAKGLMRFYSPEYMEALHISVEATLSYLRAWFPEMIWRFTAGRFLPGRT